MFRRFAALTVLVGALVAGCATQSANTGQVSDASTPTGSVEEAAAKPVAEAPTWGKRYTWDDGLAIEVAAPTACTPSEYAAPENIERAVKFKVTVVNGTDQAFDTAVLTIGADAQFDGAKAEAVFDMDGDCGSGGAMDSATVLPGKTYTFEQAYSVGAEPGEMQLAFQPDFVADKAVFTGQA